MNARGEIRRRAREHLSEGAVTQNYGGKVEDAVALLNHAVATEIVCILRYKFHAVCATGLASEAVKESLAEAVNKHKLEIAALVRIPTKKEAADPQYGRKPLEKLIMESILVGETKISEEIK